MTAWFAEHARPLPWRPAEPAEPRDPWRALVSEIMAQQTQIARVAERFGPFVERFPTPTAMALANEDEVLALWSGLGYYRRARNLHAAARAIVADHGGATPTTAAELITLPGVGRYTAGAVASIAAHEVTPIVDGNIARVLVRLHARELAHGTPQTMAWAWPRAAELARVAGADRIAPFNEGLMELGATVCAPRDPDCAACPLRDACRARARGRQRDLPHPKPRANRSIIYAAAAILTDARGRVLLEQRPQNGLWAGLWQPITIESEGTRIPRSKLTAHVLGGGEGELALRKLGAVTIHTTHREVPFGVWGADIRSPLTRRLAHNGRRWVALADLAALGLGSAQRKVLALGVALPA